MYLVQFLSYEEWIMTTNCVTFECWENETDFFSNTHFRMLSMLSAVFDVFYRLLDDTSAQPGVWCILASDKYFVTLLGKGFRATWGGQCVMWWPRLAELVKWLFELTPILWMLNYVSVLCMCLYVWYRYRPKRLNQFRWNGVRR